MAQGTISPIVWADEPAQWPTLPEWMSFHRLLEIERCPRRAALRTANYPDLWQRHGYPPKLRLPNLLGQIVHSSVRTIGSDLANNGCLSASDGRAVFLLTQWGGLTQLVHRTLESVLTEQSTNPRGIGLRRALYEGLERRIPTMREQVQIMLSRLQLSPSVSAPRQKPKPAAVDSRGLKTHSELELRSPTLRWVGIADHVSVGEDHCEIIDFKTGEPAEDHKLQIRIYALLWASDERSNPTHVLADKLTLSYGNQNIDVPVPNETELQKLAQTLADRTAVARNVMQAPPPQAKPSLENCSFCDVRHLCSTYWTHETQRQLSQHSTDTTECADVQLTITGRQAVKAWKAIVVSSSSTLPKGASVILRTSVLDSSIDEFLSSNPGKELRLLDVRLNNIPADGSPAILVASERTEGFLLR